MTREETQMLIASIKAVYPNFKIAPEELTFTVNAWHTMLEEYPYEGIQAAFKIYVKTNNTGFAPSVSQLINAMYQPKENNQLSEGEAWAMVKRAIQDGCYHAGERYNELPPMIQRAVGSPNMISQWAQTDSDTVNTVIMSNFQRTYRTLLQKQSFNDKVPETLSGLVTGIVDHLIPQYEPHRYIGENEYGEDDD